MSVGLVVEILPFIIIGVVRIEAKLRAVWRRLKKRRNNLYGREAERR